MHFIDTGSGLSYISETVQLVADHASRTRCRSASTAPVHYIPRLRALFGGAYCLLVLWHQGLECAPWSVSFD